MTFGTSRPVFRPRGLPVAVLVFILALLPAGHASVQGQTTDAPSAADGFKTYDVGNLRFRAPANWIHRAGAKKQIWYANKKKDSAFSWRIVGAHGKPAKQFAALLKRDYRGRRILRSSRIRGGKLPSGLMVWTTYRLARGPRGGRLYAFHVYTEIMGAGYLFTYAANRPGTYRTFMRGPFKPLLAGVRAHVPVIPRPKAPDTGNSLKLFAFAMPLGSGWKEKRYAGAPLPSYMKHYQIPSGVKKQYQEKLDIFYEFALGRPAQPDVALRAWLKNTYLPRVPGVSRRRTMRSFFARSWKFAPGETGATYRVWYRSYNSRLTYIAVHVLATQDYTIFAGTSADVTRLSKKQRKGVMARHEKLNLNIIGLAARARFELPGRVEKWESWLRRRKTFRYFYESSTGSPLTTWVVRTRKINWDFRRDGTCRSKSSGYFGVSIHSYNDPYNPSRSTDWTYGTREKKGGTGPARCLVHGTGDSDLWIIARRPGKPGTFHRLVPEARGTFGVFKPRGLSIDGYIEGKYSRTNNARVWKSWKKK